LITIYTLYYYDRPLLEAWLNHYCHIPCIDEIIIQNQNWSNEDTLYLLDIAAKYIDDYQVKIAILPSQFKRIDGPTKRAQFRKYGQPQIRNRVMLFLKDGVWILGSMDEVIYDKSYGHTDKKLREFAEFAEERAKQGKNTLGYLQFWTVCSKGLFATEYCSSGMSPTWKNRVLRFVDFPFIYSGTHIHDETMTIFKNARFVEVGHQSGFHRLSAIQDPCFMVDLNIYHYQPLVRPNTESPEFTPIKLEDIPQLEVQPKYYLEKLVDK